MLVIELRKLGYDVLTSKDANQDNQGISDPDVLAFATKEKRAVITYNRKDFRKLHQKFTEHGGIIVCKEDRNDTESAQTINEQLQQFSSLNNQFIAIKKL